MMPATPASSDFATSELDQAFLQNYARLVAFGRKHARRPDDAEEYVHEAYLRSRRGWNAERESNDRPEAYFFRALRWALADGRRACREHAVDPASMDACFASREREPILLEAGLSPAEQELLDNLCRGRDKDELCRELQISPGALAVRICRARRKLEARIGIRRLQSNAGHLHCTA